LVHLRRHQGDGAPVVPGALAEEPVWNVLANGFDLQTDRGSEDQSRRRSVDVRCHRLGVSRKDFGQLEPGRTDVGQPLTRVAP
jgi:hypothetical protein